MDLGIRDKVALVTGAASGIGEETARQLLEEGATVVLNDVQKDQLEKKAQTFSETEGFAGKVFSYPADIVDQTALKQMHDYIADKVGTIDILVQNAGIVGEQGLFHELDDEVWLDTIETDLMGPVRLVREFLPDLRRGGLGSTCFNFFGKCRSTL